MRHLLAFGTENYSDGADRLKQVPAELKRVVQLFGGFDYAEQLTDLRLDPTSTTLRIELERWFRDGARSPDDVAVVYYTGHGFTRGGVHYLATADTRPGYVGEALRAEVFVELLGPEPTIRRVLVILDVCFAGAGALDAAGFAHRIAPYQEPFGRGEGVWIIAASRPREEAEQGAFVGALAEAVAADETPSIQEHLSLEALIDRVNERLGPAQQAGYIPAGLAMGLPPFLPNRRYDPDAPSGDDLETARLRRAHDVRSHWDPKSRGVDVARQAGRYFRGRRAATDAILTWLAGPATHPPVCVVTGQPGAGKSALLGHVLFLCNPDLRGARPAAVEAAAGIRIDSAILARGKTDRAVLDELAADLGERPADTASLGAAILRRPVPVTTLVDALDEAEAPDAVIERVLRPLVEECDGSFRVLLGTRSTELEKLPVPLTTVNLDDPEFYRRADVADYVQAVLTAEDDPESTSAYRGSPGAARAAAEVVAERARGNFLIARVAARTLARGTHPLGPDEVAAAAPVWDAVGTAFDQDLARYGDDATRVRDLLLPLAYGRGSGLPRETLWAPIATALTGGFTTYDDSDVGWLQDHAGAYVVESAEDGRAVYRLIHQELADHLRAKGDRATAEGWVVDALLDRVPAGPAGRPGWFAAHPYLRRHLATHARAAGRIDELLRDPGFLLAAEPTRLRRAALEARSVDGAAAAAVVLLALEHLRDGAPADRAAALALAARLRDQHQLAADADALFPDMPWRARWADWHGPDPHRTLTRMDRRVSVLAAWETAPDRWYVAVGSGSTVRVLDLESADTVHELGLGASVESLAVGRIDGDQLLLAGAGDGRLHVVRTSGWSASTIQAHQADVRAVACGWLDGERIVVTAGREARSLEEGTIRIWRAGSANATTWEPLTPPRPVFGGGVRRVHVLDIDGRTTIAVAGDPLYDPEEAGGMVRFFDARSAQSTGSLPTGRTGIIDTHAQAGSPLVCRQFVGGLQDRLAAWDLTSRTLAAESTVGSGNTNQLCPILAAGAPALATATHHTIELRDPLSLEPLEGWRPLAVNGVAALCAAESRGRSVLLSGGDDGAVRVWDLGWRYTTAGAVTETRGERLVATGDRESGPVALVGGAVPPRLYELVSGAWRSIGEQRGVSAVALADGRAFCAYGRVVHSYGLDDGVPGPSFEGHVDAVVALAAGRVGHRMLLATAGQDYGVRIWDAQTGDALSGPLMERPYRDKMTRALAIVSLPSGPTLVAAGSTGHLVTFALDRLPGDPASSELPGEHRDYVNALAHDGGMLYSAGDDGKLVGLDLALNQVTHRQLGAHRGAVTALACTEAAGVAVLVSGGRDGYVRVWRRRPDLDLVAAIPLDAPVRGLSGHGGVVVAGTDAGVVALDLAGLPAAPVRR